VWIEAWDATYNLPYYLNFATGESQWQWPAEVDEAGNPVHIVQHGSEDYNWFVACRYGNGQGRSHVVCPGCLQFRQAWCEGGGRVRTFPCSSCAHFPCSLCNGGTLFA
jgi:hypothetical protein